MRSPALEEADRLPSRAIVHVRFEELARDPLAQLERIYGSIQLEDLEPARPRIEAYLDSIRDYSKSSHTFARESIAAVIERWQSFVTRLGYPPPALERCAVIEVIPRHGTSCARASDHGC